MTRRTDYEKGYAAGYKAGRRYVSPPAKAPQRVMSSETKLRLLFDAMVKGSPARGGYMWEGARAAFEAGTYHDWEIEELLRRGWIKPHPDPAKGWVPCLIDPKEYAV